jgi:hypothetical protein
VGLFKSKSEHRDLVIAYKRIFNSQDGKLVLFDIMNRNYVLNTHGGDAFKEGRRAAILEILQSANISIEKLDEFLKGMEK